MTEVEVEIMERLDSLDPLEWDAMVDPEDPFMEHAFLSAAERSDSVGPEHTGWVPCHLVVRREGKLAAAMPLYMKSHSYGEFIFDFAWASGAERAGLPYYPKLVSAAPFTPATGQRILVAPDQDRASLEAVLVRAAQQFAERTRASSLHLLFCSEAEQISLRAHHMMPRLSHQFHWLNTGDWRCFDDFLAALRSGPRKQLKRERRRAQESGLRCSMRSAAELNERDWEALWKFYRTTVQFKGSFAYLTPEFFEELARQRNRRVVAAMAHDGEEPIAGALFFQKGASLYGRYWGCVQDVDMLHFELCYYLPMEWGLTRGMRRFEAGAQGAHKIKRGFMPRPCYSSHWFRNEGLAEAVRRFLPDEAGHVQREIEGLSRHGPFPREHRD